MRLFVARLALIILILNLCHGFLSYYNQPIRSVICNEGRSCGIDLGTTYSLVSIVEESRPKLLPIDNSTILPSIVTYINPNSILVGQDAVKAREKYPESTFSSVKRVIGRTYETAIKNGDSYLFGKRLIPIAAEDDKNDNKEYCGLYCKSLQKTLKPEEISAEILKKLIQRAEEYYHGEKITRAVITVPAYFNPLQRAATERAGKLAGIEKIKLLKEPEAAAIAYGLTKEEPQLILVIDLGGGTFDVSVLEVGDGLVEVIATNGDSHLGGDDFDKAIVDWILTDSKCISIQAEQHIRSNIHLFNKVKLASTEAKIALSKRQNVTISIPSVYREESINILLSRKKFDSLVRPLLQRLLKPIRDVAIMAGINLPGESGIANMDYIEEAEILSNNNYDLKAMEEREKQGRQRSKQRQKVKGRLVSERNKIQKLGGTGVKFFPGGQPISDVLLVGGATRMQCIISLVRVLTGIDPKRYINPDEAICLGAGVLAGTLDGRIQGFEIMSQWKSAWLRTLYEDPSFAKTVEEKGKEKQEKKNEKPNGEKMQDDDDDDDDETILAERKKLSIFKNKTRIITLGKPK